MDVIANIFMRGHGMQDIVRDVFGMRGAETHSQLGRYLRHFGEQYIEGVFIVIIAVHILPQQCDFSKSVVVQILTLSEDTLHIPAALATSSEGHHTKGTHVVAASHDADE